MVWITKYRHKLLRGPIAERVRDMVREECRRAKVDILKGHVAVDPVPILVSILPQVAMSRLIQQVKGKSSYRLVAAFAEIRKRCWGRHVGARGYFCRRSGQVTDEVIKAYSEQQSQDSDDVFRIEGEDAPSGESPSS
jgi:putative transposase